MKAPFLKDASILISGECIESTFPELLKEFSKDRVVLTACPEAESCSGFVGKIAMMVRCSSPKEILVLTVDGSPYCNLLHASVDGALFATRAKISARYFVIARPGEVREVRPSSIRVGRYLHLVDKCIQRCPDVTRELKDLSLVQRDANCGV